MKPFRIFLIYIGIFIVIGLLSLLAPTAGFHLIGGLNLRLPDMKEFLRSTEKSYPDVTTLSQRILADSTTPLNPLTLIHHCDTLYHAPVGRFLEYPDSSKTALDPFFRLLSRMNSNAPCIHILHYGDSQLEADRITEYLRYRFQSEFGGNGPGVLSLVDETPRLSLQFSSSGNWKRFTLIGTPMSLQGKRPYGALASYYRFNAPEDSLSQRHAAWIMISVRHRSGERTQQFSRCRVFYTNSSATVKASFFMGDQQVLTDTLLPTSQLQTAECILPDSPETVKINFTGKESPDFYGICLDSQSGVCVDNVAMRGSSGLEFTRMDPVILSGFLQNLNARLMILQFGVNAIPGNLPDYSYYENGLYRQLSYLKQMDPTVCIIVIGVSDASQKVGDQYETYPSVEKIVAAQRSATRRAGCVFWNLYEAMGGKNSMPGWVFAKEPLATTDFLHFNFSGARMVGKMFYSALIQDYNEYLIKRR
jgi:hypothetical protein